MADLRAIQGTDERNYAGMAQTDKLERTRAHKQLSLEQILWQQPPHLQLHIPPDNLGVLPPPKGDPSFELKPLPENLKYAYLDEKSIYPVIISANLSGKEEERLLEVLKKHVAYLHLKYGKVPVYSANPWIDSFAHTVYDVISQQSIKFITSMIQT